MTEPMKCANCGGPIWETQPWVWVHLKQDGRTNYDLGEKRCDFIATPSLPATAPLPSIVSRLLADAKEYRAKMEEK